jgi:ATP-dependent Clp protease protease subunit
MPRKNCQSNEDDYEEGFESEYIEMIDEERTAALLKRRIVLLTEEVDDKKTDEVNGSLTELSLLAPEKDIILFINSNGGDVDAGLEMYDFMTTLLKAPVIGVVGAKCNSMALIVLQGCAKRVATPHSTFLIHPIQIYNVSIKYGDAMDEQWNFNKKTLEEHFKKYNKILEKHSKMSIQEIKRLSFANQKRGTTLSAKEAFKKGLIDEIVEGGDKYKIF